MSEAKIKPGDIVTVDLPNGEYIGVVKGLAASCQLTGEIRYLVKGNDPKPFETITSSRSMNLRTDK